jgi:hypothetical protein
MSKMCVTPGSQRLLLVEQELLTLPEHLSSPPVFSVYRSRTDNTMAKRKSTKGQTNPMSKMCVTPGFLNQDNVSEWNNMLT